ncbi:MAG: DNA methyltransferase [Candidatus Caldatribacteriota bacterium]|nr:DNA methyltransferase [Candidatus Caldatribacteriota bacterium]
MANAESIGSIGKSKIMQEGVQIFWKKRYGGGAKEKHLITLHEYVVVYAKDKDSLEDIFVPLEKSAIKRYYKQKDGNFEQRGPYRTHPLEATKSMGERKNLVFPIPGPNCEEIWPKRQWLWSKERVEKALANGEIEFLKGRDDEWSVHSKQYLYDKDGNIRKGKFFSIVDDVFSQHGTNEIIDLFGEAQIFSFPKPTGLLERLIDIACPEGGLIVDLFAGSGSFGHASFSFNLRGGKTTNFIAVQLPEIIDDGSVAFNKGYKTIAEIGKERIRRAAVKIREENPDYKGDLGLKVFKLDSSNIRAWNPDRNDLEHSIIDHTEHLIEGRSQEDVLYELLLKRGVDLTVPIETREITTKGTKNTKKEKESVRGFRDFRGSKKVFSIGYGVLFACLDTAINREEVEDLAMGIIAWHQELEPASDTQVVFRDSAFENDIAKTNMTAILEQNGIKHVRSL